ncbi:hypothetical protein B0T22DRAFT_487142 [Podospora appendiculata]|uniref:Uncharacterized protein n=1 Tax=Podospora appendiculata TaxID=314037 RepID=A0AAE1CGM3_9PEZI|nr:hypothetical protein B0T22DRAFT_487142 [Podospora appendiculata]
MEQWQQPWQQQHQLLDLWRQYQQHQQQNPWQQYQQNQQQNPRQQLQQQQDPWPQQQQHHHQQHPWEEQQQQQQHEKKQQQQSDQVSPALPSQAPTPATAALDFQPNRLTALPPCVDLLLYHVCYNTNPTPFIAFYSSFSAALFDARLRVGRERYCQQTGVVKKVKWVGLVTLSARKMVEQGVFLFSGRDLLEYMTSPLWQGPSEEEFRDGMERLVVNKNDWFAMDFVVDRDDVVICHHEGPGLDDVVRAQWCRCKDSIKATT